MRRRNKVPASEKYRPANVARIVYNLVFFAVFVYFKLTVVYPLSVLHLVFAVSWITLIELEILIEKEHWWSGYIPATADLLWISVMVYVTGNISSFVIIGYFISISLSSMTDSRNYGIYNVILSSVLYAGVGASVYAGLLPAVNILMDPVRPPLLPLVIASVSMLGSFYIVNQVVSRLFLSLNGEVRTRKKAEDRLRRDLELAHNVQQSIIPAGNRFPVRSEFRFGSCYIALDSVGGDLYDVIPLTGNRFGFLIADVSGHGVSAALVTTMAKASFSNAAPANTLAHEVCATVNRDMFKFIGDSVNYLTAFYCVVDLNTGSVNYCNAGHHPALLVRGSTCQELKSENTFPIGVWAEFDIESGWVSLAPGDRILLFTDGITEASNPAFAQYGESRFQDFIAQSASLNASDFVENLILDLKTFCAGTPIHDDRAVLCIDYLRDSD